MDDFYVLLAISTWGVVGGDSGGLYVTLSLSGPCVMLLMGVCVIPNAVRWEWQMLRTCLGGVTREQGLSMCPLLGHLVGSIKAL